MNISISILGGINLKSKVSLVECREYDYDMVKKSIIKSLENLGGLDSFVKKGETVLLKLNLVMRKDPDRAATTHPIFTKALAEVLMENGVNVVIGDSPGGPYHEKMLKLVYRGCGIEEVANEVGAKLNYNTDIFELKNEDGLILKSITAIDILNKVDKVISISKLKTHGMMTFTGAVKNMFGIVPGILKAEYHYRFKDYESFSNALVDICIAVKPVLSFMDGIVGMEGNGPTAGTPREVGVVIASNSPYHLDIVATSIIGLNASKVPTIQRCIERGLCEGNLDDIELLGDNINDFSINDFIVPEAKNTELLKGRVPKFLEGIIGKQLQPKPVFNYKGCVGCGDCAESCPPKVIDMVNKKPVVNLDGCIRCFCCQELCPAETIDIHRPLLMKLLSKL